jgi:hypothetical protein
MEIVLLAVADVFKKGGIASSIRPRAVKRVGVF